MKFNFYLGGYGRGNSYHLLLQRDVLLISTYQGIPIPEHDQAVEIQNNKDWQLLLDFLKDCHWHNRYDSDTMDGTQWELTVSGNGFKIKSYGSNHYPENFDKFLALLNKLTEGVGITLDE